MDPLGDGELAANDESLLKLFKILKPKVKILLMLMLSGWMSCF